MIAPRECHGRLSFPDRPPAGTSPWTWWWEVFSPAGVLLYLADLAGGDLAHTYWTDRGPYVSLHYKLTGVQRAEVLAHEMHHLSIGGVCSTRCERNEAKVIRETSRWLLPDVEGIAARLRKSSLGRVAADLGVPTVAVLERLDNVTPSERRTVDDVLRGRVDWPAECRAARSSLMATS